MHNLTNTAMRSVAAISTGIVMMTSAGAMAADKVSADFNVSYNSHFVSYGADVWGAGGDFYGDRSTTFVSGTVTVKPTDALSFNVGAWADVNNNAPSSIGGDIQEIDVWIGGNYTIGGVTLGATYQQWNYASDVEEIVDLSVGFDDSSLWGGGFAVNPNVVWHIRTDGNGAQETGSAIVLSVGPEFKLTEQLSLTIPGGVGIFVDDDFQGGTDGGYAYSYVGGSLSMPVSFIPADYGAWSVNFDLIAYFTDSEAIPNNPEENFVTGSVGMSLSF